MNIGRSDRVLGWLPYRRVRVRGASMSPTLSPGDVVLVRRGAGVRESAVVVVSWRQRPGRLSVKRAVRRDGDGWFVLGDFAEGSTDSRQLGPALVHGTVLARLWPRPRRLR